jgi:hypothetical protein
VNPGQTDITVRASLRSKDGLELAEKRIHLEPGALLKSYLNDLFDPGVYPVAGNIHLVSDREFSAVSFLEYQQGRLEALNSFPTAYFGDQLDQVDSQNQENQNWIKEDQARPGTY